MSVLWGGRFQKQADSLFEGFNQSFSFDWKLLQADVIGSKAYASALKKAKVLFFQHHVICYASETVFFFVCDHWLVVRGDGGWSPTLSL